MSLLHKFSTGRSGCPVSLIDYKGQCAVLKQNLTNVDEIIRVSCAIPLPMPEIYEYTETSITMEYINGLDIKTYLSQASSKEIHALIDYISSYFDISISSSQPYDFRNFMEQKMLVLKKHGVSIPVRKTEFLRGVVHGDFTFDNLIFKNGKFYMIDITPSEYTGINFDANKLRQDLTGNWFIREEINKKRIKIACDKIYYELQSHYSFLFDDDLYRFMFARVLPYCQTDFERDFIKKAIS